MPRVSIIDEVMPGHYSNESIVAYVIRQRRARETRARAMARLQRQLALIILAPLILAGVVVMVAAIMSHLL